jgi:hypothetical protein
MCPPEEGMQLVRPLNWAAYNWGPDKGRGGYELASYEGFERGQLVAVKQPQGAALGTLLGFEPSAFGVMAHVLIYDAGRRHWVPAVNLRRHAAADAIAERIVVQSLMPASCGSRLCIGSQHVDVMTTELDYTLLLHVAWLLPQAFSMVADVPLVAAVGAHMGWQSEDRRLTGAERVAHLIVSRATVVVMQSMLLASEVR